MKPEYNIGTDDTVVVYVTGHGVENGRTGLKQPGTTTGRVVVFGKEKFVVEFFNSKYWAFRKDDYSAYDDRDKLLAEVVSINGIDIREEQGEFL